MSVIDLFAGPGGWDLAALEFGIQPLGIEFDDAACATREAAGLETIQADVADLNPLDFRNGGGLAGLIASPPCQAFSMAGKGEGRKAIDLYCKLILEAWGDTTIQYRDELDEIRAVCGDPRAHLVLEPLRWAEALAPDWIALEQVEPVLPIWEAMAAKLREWGYSAWTGVLSAEQYGVPQTRRRAFLIARRSVFGDVSMPQPTHQRYIAPKTKLHDKQEESLFDGGDRGRIVLPEDAALLPWVSMAEALGWVEGPSPSPTVTSGGTATGGVEVFASKASRERAAAAVAFKKPYGGGMIERHGDRDGRPADRPAPVITEKARSAEWQRTHLRAGTNENDVSRSVDEPAATLRFGERANAVDWIENRPATTVAGDSRVFPPARADRNPDYQPGDGPVSQANGGNAVRVTQQEAAILQSFPPDYPWQGSKTKQFQQIGNAVPPLLALAVLREAVPVAAESEVAA